MQIPLVSTIDSNTIYIISMFQHNEFVDPRIIMVMSGIQ